MKKDVRCLEVFVEMAVFLNAHCVQVVLWFEPVEADVLEIDRLLLMLNWSRLRNHAHQINPLNDFTEAIFREDSQFSYIDVCLHSAVGFHHR